MVKWLEIVELRAAGAGSEQTARQLQRLIARLTKDSGNETLKIYHLESVDTDFSVHLHHESRKVEKGGSSLGLHLASTLKDFGLVNHTVWVETSGE